MSTKVEVGQIYKRTPPSDAKHFPEKSWKVIVVRIERDRIFHRICEYNGDKRSGGQIFNMEEDSFLENYTLDE